MAPATRATPSPTLSTKKGTFTDDLHKLVDDWAKDASNNSSCKVWPGQSRPMTRQKQVQAEQVPPVPPITRKLSAPAQLGISRTRSPSPSIPSTSPGPVYPPLGPYMASTVRPQFHVGQAGTALTGPWSGPNPVTRSPVLGQAIGTGHIMSQQCRPH
uniref:serine/threonine-protein kinase WNK1-like n=1 Tax=Myxine glutinosa TaxID=7769 RepID=UPI00358EA218